MALVLLCRRICASNKHGYPNFKQRLLNTINASNRANLGRAPLLKNRWFMPSSPKRSFFGFFKKLTKEQIKVKDDVPDAYSLIYQNTMNRYVLLAQLVSTLTAFVVCLVLIIQNDFSKLQLDLSDWATPPRATNNESYVYMTAFVTIVVILQLMVSRLPIRIYYLPQQKNYIFVFHGNLPYTQRKLTCKIGEVYPVPDAKLAPWKEVTYGIKDNQKIILIEHYFRKPADLYIMLGVQRDRDVEEK